MPHVAAILVVADGEEWLPNVLATIAGQRYPALDLVVVDNASRDGSADLLARRIPPGHLITLPRRVGFGRAAWTAMQHEVVAAAELTLLLHDDLVLAPNALAHLVRALRRDPALSVVGPKLREWSEEKVLAEVGMTIDHLGRAESLLEPGELDQGQHDRQREVLYVSSAGMLLRREVLETIGSFDLRFPLFRDDLDLCWRAWVAGHRVEVVPAAVGYHLAAASRLLRPVGRGRPWEPRELAERHALAAMLKNYGALRLAWVLPLVLLIAVAKTLAFLVTRRFGDALAVVRAHVWNVAQLPRTLRRRRAVQRLRQVSDQEIVRLFAPGIPRLRAYAEAFGGWMAGGTPQALYEDVEELPPDIDEETSGARALLRLVRAHPAGVTALALLLAYLIGAVPLLGAGPLVGGEILPWPASAWDFLRSYAGSWNGEPIGSAGFASPFQPLLGALSFLGLGSPWLAQRLLVLGVPVLAWVLALRAGRLLTVRTGARALGATLYVLSPAVVGALAQGRYGVLVAAALLPGLVLFSARACMPGVSLASAWRAAALLALGLTAAVGAAPALGAVFTAALLAVLAVVFSRRHVVGAAPLFRLLVALAAALGLLAPWFVSLARAGLPPAASDASLPLWRAVAVAPAGLGGLAGVGGFLAAAVTAAVVVVALLLGFVHRPAVVAALVSILVASALLAWGAGVADVAWLWAPALLVPGALALAGLGVIAARGLATGLRQRAFGMLQLTVVVAVLVAGVGMVAAVVRLAAGPWEGLHRAVDVLPPFVTADGERVGPYRVVVVSDDGSVVRWDVVSGEGPTMRDVGTVPAPHMLAAVGDAVGAAVGGGDPRAADQLGLVNVRYIVVEEDGLTARLEAALARQPALEPLPGQSGRVYRVRSWLPRAVVLPPERADALVGTGRVGDTADLEDLGLRQVSRGRYAGTSDAPGLLVVSEAVSDLWRVRGAAVQRRALPPVNAFEKPSTTGLFVVFAAGAFRHNTVILLQVLLLLAVVSLALRPPGFGQRRAERALRRLPETLEPDEDAPSGPRDEATGEPVSGEPVSGEPVSGPVGAPVSEPVSEPVRPPERAP